MPSYDWANSMVLLADVFLVWYGFSAVGVGVIIRKGRGIQGRNFLKSFQESEMAVCQCRNWTYYV